MAPVPSELIDAQEAHEAFLELAAGFGDVAVTYRKQARQALAMAVAGYCLDPNAKSPPRNEEPVLLGVMQNLRVEAGDKPLVGRLDVSADATTDWPSVGLDTISHRERLAMWLVRAGADPWVTDQAGKDTLDLAVEAGSRSVVSLLLSHPQCPSLETLALRASNFPGRQVPWLHVAAYTGNAGLFEDLVAMGCDIHATDRQGWTALGWVNSPSMMNSMLEKHTFSSQEIVTASEAWQKRLLGKLVPSGFKVESLRVALEARVPPSEEQVLQTKLTDMANRWLSAKPTDKNYHFKGATVTGIYEKDRGLSDLIQNHWDWRLEIPSGAAKGTWSLLGAAVWGIWRGHVDGGEDTRKKVAGWALQQLEQVGPAKAKAWLEEAFRPGLTNRSMLAWLVMSDTTPDQKKALMGDSASLVWQEMVAFAKSTGTATNWVKHLSYHFKSTATQYAQLFPSACDTRFWNGVADFAQGLGFYPSVRSSSSDAPEYALVATRSQATMIHGTGVSEETRQAWFRALVILISSSSYRNSGTEVVSSRIKMWDGVVQAQRKDPVLFAFPSDLPPPFTEKEAGQAPPGQPVPSPSEWRAMLTSQKLDQDLTNSAPSVPRRPRM